MADENAANSGANTEGNTGATGATNQNAGAQQQSATTGAQTTAGTTEAQTGAAGKVSFTPEQQAYINSLVKNENQKAVEKATKKFNDEKDLSEKERAEKRANELELALAERDKKDAFMLTTKDAKIVDPNALYKLVEGELEFENGKFKNLSKILDGAKVTYPFLFPSAEGSADAGGKDEETSTKESEPGVGRMRDAYAETKAK